MPSCSTCLLWPLRRRWAAAGVGLLSLMVAWSAAAERSDRTKPLTMEADRPCTVDLVRQVSICSGNVVIAQGTLVIRADRVELRELPDGYRTATAIGTAAKPATYRQRRDGGEEELEGSAERIEYDARTDTLRFTGNAQVRRLRGGQPAEDIQGSVIVWDNAAELFSVQGGAATPSNPSGRVRAVLSPRAEAASAAGSAAAATPLQPSTLLGERR
ncbi:MAG: lipopolysaccharide transport periplasmic protein LptA [Ideonella sp.]|nr:MAG: lipopolysaccharide transport periplasmic protein LptA [Burkholderiaceae bacterium]MBE7425685.1 lipopolysaccharide transport periplasmic protein LptA [Ideonella sp.]